MLVHGRYDELGSLYDAHERNTILFTAVSAARRTFLRSIKSDINKYKRKFHGGT